MNYLSFVIKTIGTIVSCFYPFYASFKALDAKSTESTAQWLTYWSVLSLLILFETFFGWLLQRVPLYYTMKLAFVLWLQLPQFKGAMTIYWKVLQPELKKHEDKIDHVFQESRKKAIRFKDWPTSMLNRSTTAADKVLQELEQGDMGEKGE